MIVICPIDVCHSSKYLQSIQSVIETNDSLKYTYTQLYTFVTSMFNIVAWARGVVDNYHPCCPVDPSLDTIKNYPSLTLDSNWDKMRISRLNFWKNKPTKSLLTFASTLHLAFTPYLANFQFRTRESLLLYN